MVSRRLRGRGSAGANATTAVGAVDVLVVEGGEGGSEKAGMVVVRRKKPRSAFTTRGA